MQGVPRLPWSVPILVGGRYQIVRVLGTGAQATVYLVNDLATAQWRALKIAAPGVDAEWHARFQREAKLMTRLCHRNVLRVFEVLTVAGSPAMLTELARGGSLGGWLRRNGALPAARAVEVAIQCASALEHAHRAGVLHRDVKPANVLVHKDGRVALCDFGIAWWEGDATLTNVGEVLGTLPYLAPELRNGDRAVDVRADVYGLGATLFTLCTNRRAIDLYLCCQRRELLEGVPPAVAAVIEDCCRYEPAHRLAGMDFVRERLKGALSACPTVHDRTPSLAEAATELPGMPSADEEAHFEQLRARLMPSGETSVEELATEMYTPPDPPRPASRPAPPPPPVPTLLVERSVLVQVEPTDPSVLEALDDDVTVVLPPEPARPLPPMKTPPAAPPRLLPSLMGPIALVLACVALGALGVGATLATVAHEARLEAARARLVETVWIERDLLDHVPYAGAARQALDRSAREPATAHETARAVAERMIAARAGIALVPEDAARLGRVEEALDAVRQLEEPRAGCGRARRHYR